MAIDFVLLLIAASSVFVCLYLQLVSNAFFTGWRVSYVLELQYVDLMHTQHIVATFRKTVKNRNKTTKSRI